MTAAPMAPEDTDPAPRHVGPGVLLRGAREKAGMSLRDVSTQLHLDERTITSLESDDFATLPAPAFVRGYLRGYARLLGVPVGPVMEAYDRENFSPPDLVADISEGPQANSADFPVRLTTWLVLLVLVGLVITWWNNQSVDDLGTDMAATSPLPPLPASTPVPARVPEVAADAGAPAPPGGVPPDDRAGSAAAAGAVSSEPGSVASVTTASGDGNPAAASAAPPGPGSAPAANGGAVTTNVDRIIGEAEEVLARSRETIAPVSGDRTALPGDEGERTTAPTQTDAGAASRAPAAVPDAPAEPARAVEATETAPGSARLRLSFQEEAWVEIYDANEARLFYNLAKPGRELDLRGPPPIRVLLGRAAGVTVEYDGQPVDLAPYTERGVARFTLGE